MGQILLVLLAAALLQTPADPLPDVNGFLTDVPTVVFATMLAADMMDNKYILFNTDILRQYTYTETETQTTLDSKGNPKKTEVDVTQVVRGAEDWQFYRKKISHNGVPLTEKELQKQDQEQKRLQEERHEERLRAEKKAHEQKPAPQAPVDQEKARKEMIQTFTGVYDVQIEGREVLDGRSTVLMTLKPKAGVKPKDNFLNLLHHVVLRAWFTETEKHDLVKLDANILEPVSFGLGILAKLSPGSSLVMHRQKLKDEFWVPARIDVNVNGRMFLVKGLNEHQLIEFSDFKKYTVETIVQPGAEVEPLTPK
jgi:hypothetical protein